MRRIVQFLSAAAAGMSAPALACQYDFAPEPIGGPSAKFIAPRMAAAATYVDLAVAEGESDIRGPDGNVVPWSKAVSFRVLRRWKGASSDRFLLFGRIVADAEPVGSWHLAHWVDDHGRGVPFHSVREAPIATTSGINSCSPPELAVKAGRTYLILREADGRLLGAVRYHPDSYASAGTPIAEVGLWPDHEWARQMSIVQEPPRIGAAAVPAGTPDPSRATVQFRRPLSAAAATDLLRDAGALPFAVLTNRNGLTSDYRLGSDVAWPGIVADATAWASRVQTPRPLIEQQALSVVDSYAVRDITNDTAKQQQARMVLVLAQAPPEVGPALVSAVSFIGGPAVQAALAKRAEVAAVVPATRVRERIADPPPPGFVAADPLPQLQPVEIHRRLTALAGRDLPESAIEGEWRLAELDGSQVVPGVLTLGLSGGRLSGTLSCAPVAGTYRFAGRVLEVQAAKPAVDSCPKSESRWLGEWFFDSATFTLAPKGDHLELVGENGTYRLVRN